MKFALIGKSISHSLSPQLYKKIIGPGIQYDLIDVDREQGLPPLQQLASSYNGINITSPYKEHYLSEVIIEDETVKKLRAVNTISLQPEGFFATNTDLIAVRQVLEKYKKRFEKLSILLLGSGAMARLTKLVAQELKIPLQSFARTTHPDLSHLDLSPYEYSDTQTLIINACSRDFVFCGKNSASAIFWDYNYNFYPHQNTLPFKVKEYQDGQEMLFLQAQAAWKFWLTKNAKLNC